MSADLHERIRSAIEHRLTLAERTKGEWSGVWRWEEGFGDKCNDPTCEYGSLIDEGDKDILVLMSVHGYETRLEWQGAAHIAANDPAFTIRACRADLERLERHRSEFKPHLDDDGTRVVYPCWCSPCTPNCGELLLLATVYGIEVP